MSWCYDTICNFQSNFAWQFSTKWTKLKTPNNYKQLKLSVFKKQNKKKTLHNSPFWLTLCSVLYILLYHLWWLFSSTSCRMQIYYTPWTHTIFTVIQTLPILKRLAFLVWLWDRFLQFSYDLNLPFSLVVRFRSPVHSGIRFSLNELQKKKNWFAKFKQIK